eukprot:COSAG01_NODE_707_length_14133_cov_34.324093_7_plen_1413_part_00
MHTAGSHENSSIPEGCTPLSRRRASSVSAGPTRRTPDDGGAAGRWASAAPINGGLDDESALAAAIAASTAAPAETSPQGPRRRRQQQPRRRGGREVANQEQQQQQQQRRVGRSLYEAAAAVPSSQEDWHTAQRAAGSLAEALPSLLFLALVAWAEVPLLCFSMNSPAIFVFMRTWNVPWAVACAALCLKFGCWRVREWVSHSQPPHEVKSNDAGLVLESDEQDEKSLNVVPEQLQHLAYFNQVDGAASSPWALSETTAARLAAAQRWLQWLGDAFRWSGSDASSGDVGAAASVGGSRRVTPDPAAAPPPGLRRSAAGVEGVGGSSHLLRHLLLAEGRSPAQVRREFWEEHHPPGSFLHDHWVASLLAAIVLSISLASVMYSLAHSRFLVARLLRRLAAALWRPIWAARHHLRACVLAGLALLVLEEATAVWQTERHFGWAYLLGYGAAVLSIAMLDAVSDAMGRPSTFTPERVRILLASVFAIGLPILFARLEGRGWRLLSPLCVGVGVDGLGQAFLVPALRDVAFWPVKQLRFLLELLEGWLVGAFEAIWPRLCALDRRPVVMLLGVAAAAASGAPHWQRCQSIAVMPTSGGEDAAHLISAGCLAWTVYAVLLFLCSLRAIEMLARPSLPALRSCYSSSMTAVVWCGLRTGRRTVDAVHWLYTWMSDVLSWIYDTGRPFALALRRLFRSGYALLCRLASVGWRHAAELWQALRWLATQLWQVLCRCGTWLQECAIDTGLHLYHLLYFPCRWLRRRSIDLVQTVAHGVRALWLRLTWVSRHAWHQLMRLGSWVSAAYSASWAIAQRVGARLVSAASAIGRRVLSAAISWWRGWLQPLGAAVWRGLVHALRCIGGRLADVTLAVLRPLWRWLRRALHFFLHRILSRFARAWWRLLPAALAVQTWIRFGLALFRASPPPAASAALGLMLASWAVLVISIVLIQDVYARTFNWSDVTNRQFVATAPSSAHYGAGSRMDRLLVHVDLGAVAAGRWCCRNLGHVLSTVLQHLVRWGGIVLRRGLALLWKLVRWLWQRVGLPLLRTVRAAVLVIWNSPLLCSAATLAAVSATAAPLNRQTRKPTQLTKHALRRPLRTDVAALGAPQRTLALDTAGVAALPEPGVGSRDGRGPCVSRPELGAPGAWCGLEVAAGWQRRRVRRLREHACAAGGRGGGRRGRVAAARMGRVAGDRRSHQVTARNPHQDPLVAVPRAVADGDGRRRPAADLGAAGCAGLGWPGCPRAALRARAACTRHSAPRTGTQPSRRRPRRSGGGESFLRVHWVAVPKALRARRFNRGRRRSRRSTTCGAPLGLRVLWCSLSRRNARSAWSRCRSRPRASLGGAAAGGSCRRRAASRWQLAPAWSMMACGSSLATTASTPSASESGCSVRRAAPCADKQRTAWTAFWKLSSEVTRFSSR